MNIQYLNEINNKLDVEFSLIPITLIWLISRLRGSFKSPFELVALCHPMPIYWSFTLMRLTQLSTVLSGFKFNLSVRYGTDIYFSHNPITLLASLLLDNVRSTCQSKVLKNPPGLSLLARQLEANIFPICIYHVFHAKLMDVPNGFTSM